MTRSRNLLLAEWMADHKITVRELAHQVNEAIRPSFEGTTGFSRWGNRILGPEPRSGGARCVVSRGR